MLRSCSILKNNITSIAIGGFDGMHIAHKELFKCLGKNGAIVVIETGYANLTPKIHRASHTSYPLYYYPLEDIKHLNAKEFLDLLQEEYPKLKKIVIGFDFRFGTNASYGISDLNSIFNGEVVVVDEFSKNYIAVHSRVIREYISSGDIKSANLFLDKIYSISGLHIRGQGIGAKQFVATINIKCNDFLIPQAGIYATFTVLDNKRYKSVTFIGHRLSTDKKYAIETHILNKNIKNISSNIKIEFVEKIRNNEKFEDFDKLKKKIIEDIHKSKVILDKITLTNGDKYEK
ncbi:MAG TPA: bifunctional riboflavin kinase/FAD synthetase [Arcobacter sp.]|nr:bifunctional riboflavin kinase/FAD synthetase [Arcobacter sp.]